ncbi:DNA repair protein RadA [Elstera cyanobacteriorum]|uniref:DNA repair protein RadA n=1 Tax=Elstera cyanobacteriorum TaxID=2022747 RepID=A0A255XRL4_9PROT|nr:DNA repair protein RadA [Elstera cyanobacteriorum]OYQ18890.1 DNA repair protein RadA [Elstera cyanobacteriorum]GFZ77090.1 DNA repair protein RadA [Elstera cyanobacteriorum]
MARGGSHYVCQSCGAFYAKWQGQCTACGEWNTLVEESAPPPVGGKKGASAPRTRGGGLDFVDLHGSSAPAPRRPSGIGELDRVTGGGIVPGSAILIGGDPGIGKSTLLTQLVARLAETGARCAYISGEEAVDQVRLRAGRLGISAAPVALASATALRDILPALETDNPPDVVVIDSIQTMYLDALDSAPGTVGQVRACAQELIRAAKKRGFALILVGHVTKEGAIAGPRVLEHMVDTVLYFEGERGHQFRILRAVKNRFGPTDEIGVFEMTDRGLSEVPNPSALFLAERRDNVSGAAVFAGMEGTRPVLVEIQALVAPTSFGTPRRAVVGWDSGRLAMVMAVLDARCGLSIGAQDVYLNVAGGLRISEPAADLAVAAALVSAYSGEPVPPDMVVFGEVGLAGEVRQVGQTDARLKEALRLGFGRALIPARRAGAAQGSSGLTLTEIDRLAELVERLAPAEDNTWRRKLP